MTATPDLLSFDHPDLAAFFCSLGERPFRAGQVMQWVYKRGARDFATMTDISKGLRERLAGSLRLSLPEVLREQRSEDGTSKLLLALADGARIETVLIPDEDRLTQCVSSQSGCAMGCVFCDTAAAGAGRNLTAGEIVGQVLLGEARAGPSRRVSNVVFMGMGEPLLNRDNVVRAFRVLSDDHGLNITKRRLTVSTCGLVDEMKRLPADVLPSLAISLNATTDELRDRLMPVNRKYPIPALLEALRKMPLPPRARYTIEYVLLGGVNDTTADARRLVKLLSGIRCKVNLIPYNPAPWSSLAAPAPEAVEAFQSYLLGKNFTAVLRKSRGRDIAAACGQLRADGRTRVRDAGRHVNAGESLAQGG
jgi:23S rRNA (adenine2503-C2)-methyltransferase